MQLHKYHWLAAYDPNAAEARLLPWVKQVPGTKRVSTKRWIQTASVSRITHRKNDREWYCPYFEYNEPPTIQEGDGQFFVLNEDAIGYKKVKYGSALDDRAILVLLIPAGAVTFLSDSKCRTSEAYVLHSYGTRRYFLHGIHKIRLDKGLQIPEETYSMYLPSFKYHVGDFVEPQCGLSNDYDECSDGIHFFKYIEQAIEY